MSKRKSALQAALLNVIGDGMKCYAARLHANRGGKIKGYADVFERPEMFSGRMTEAAKWKDLAGAARPDKPWLDGCRRLVFVSDMGDVLSVEIPFEFLKAEIINGALSENGLRHLWLWLSKRPSRMAQFAEFISAAGLPWPKNVVAMTSVTSQKTVGRVAQLIKVPATIRGLSVEPLWERVTLPLEGIHWVIVGGESGPRSKPFDLAWARDLREQCRAAGVALFLKQLGANPVENGKPLKLNDKHGGDWNEWPEDLRIREVPGAFRHV